MKRMRPRAASSRVCSADGAAGRTAGWGVCVGGGAGAGARVLVGSAARAPPPPSVPDGSGRRPVLPDGAALALGLCALCRAGDAPALCAVRRGARSTGLVPYVQPAGAAPVCGGAAAAGAGAAADLFTGARGCKNFFDFFQKTLCNCPKMGYNNRQGIRAAKNGCAGKEGQKA